MRNKPVFVGIVRTRSRFDEEFSHWLGMNGYGYGESPTFSIGYGDVYILVIILVPIISLSLFKLLKYSQLIK